MIDPPVPWRHARPLLNELAAEAASRPAHFRANVDKLTAYVRDYLDRFDLRVGEPAVVYEALVVLSLVAECARNAASNDLVTADEAESVASFARAVAHAFVPYAPAEVLS